MRNELELMELVDRYLDGTMEPKENDAFRERLDKEAELRDLLRISNDFAPQRGAHPLA